MVSFDIYVSQTIYRPINFVCNRNFCTIMQYLRYLTMYIVRRVRVSYWIEYFDTVFSRCTKYKDSNWRISLKFASSCMHLYTSSLLFTIYLLQLFIHVNDSGNQCKMLAPIHVRVSVLEMTYTLLQFTEGRNSKFALQIVSYLQLGLKHSS